MLELVPSIFILLFFVVFPLINLMGLVVGNAVCNLVTNQAASLAAAQPTFNDALAAMANESGMMFQSGFARFVKLRPVSGFTNIGTDLYIHATNYTSNQVTKYGPNVPLPPPVDTSTFVYEYQVQGSFDVGPIVNMSSMPFIGGIPGLGAPARFTTSAMRLVEHPQGLDGAPLSGQTFTTPIPPPIPSPPPPTAPPPAGTVDSGWNFPNIYQAIANAGQTVVDEEVLRVDAINANWTATSIMCDSNTKIWIDYRSDGSWSWGNGPNAPMVDANGDSNPINNGSPYDGFPMGAMVGKIGANGPIFLLGKEKWNFIPPGTGELFIMFADSDQNGSADPRVWSDNTGSQTVRVVAAQ